MWMIWAAAAWAAPSLSTDTWTWELGGRATVDFWTLGVQDSSVTLYPRLGVFLSENVELIGGVGLFLADGGSASAFFVGAEYLFDGSGVRPYLGGTVGYGAVEFPRDQGPQDVIATSLLLGILVPCSRKIGVDIGGRANLYLWEEDPVLHIPMGYLGVRAFFP